MAGATLRYYLQLLTLLVCRLLHIHYRPFCDAILYRSCRILPD